MTKSQKVRRAKFPHDQFRILVYQNLRFSGILVFGILLSGFLYSEIWPIPFRLFQILTHTRFYIAEFQSGFDKDSSQFAIQSEFIFQKVFQKSDSNGWILNFFTWIFQIIFFCVVHLYAKNNFLIKLKKNTENMPLFSLHDHITSNHVCFGISRKVLQNLSLGIIWWIKIHFRFFCIFCCMYSHYLSPSLCFPPF